MSAQTRYGYTTPIGAAGGIVDLAPHSIDTFLNEEESGVLKFGVGVVRGSKPGVNIALPTEDATAAEFEGITTNNRTTEYDLEGKLHVRNGAAVGVMRYGKIYGRVAEGVEPAYGDPVYLIVSGDEAGCFTNEASDAEDDGGAGDAGNAGGAGGTGTADGGGTGTADGGGTGTADGGETTEAAATIAIKARFLGGVDTSVQVAPIELFNQAQA